MGDERRRYKRLPASLIARIRTRRATQPEALQMQVSNVSTGGVFIDTPYPFPPGTLLEFDFNLPGSTEMVYAKGVVRWVRADGPDRGMGVEFMEVSTDSRHVLHDYIQRQAADTRTRPEGGEAGKSG